MSKVPCRPKHNALVVDMYNNTYVQLTIKWSRLVYYQCPVECISVERETVAEQMIVEPGEIAKQIQLFKVNTIGVSTDKYVNNYFRYAILLTMYFLLLCGINSSILN